ncbi:MAG: DUF1553 domain-containing protein [Verrucomicrobiota bacterium]
MRKLLILALAFPAVAAAIDFNRDVRPILSNKCFACHGFDEHDRKADLRLDTKEGAFEDLGGYAAIVPGNLDDSEAWYRIITDDEDELMPPPKFHKPMTQEEKDIIKQWIEEGAVYETHWSYAPLEKMEKPTEEGSMIDHLIGKALAEEGLKPAAKANKATLARRLHLDLLGIPASPTWIDAFVAAPDPLAWQKLVDSTLQDPAFGERLAVMWLDLVRYADTIGYHSDNSMEVSAYRDYVIEAFNENLSYDQFTIEQLAGDLLEAPTQRQKIASGYNRLLQTTEEGGAQANEYMAIYAADRVRNVSATWLGSTIGCAQCHDHKYDPFTMRDFYTMAAFFADVKEKPIGKRQPNFRLPTTDQETQIAQLKADFAKATINAVLKADPDLAAKVKTARAAWEAGLLDQISGGKSIWTEVKPIAVKSSDGQTLSIQGDNSVLASGNNPNHDDYTVDIEGSGLVTAFQLEVMTHSTLTRQSLSRGNGNYVLTGVTAKHGENTLKISEAIADYEQGGWPVKNAIDGNPATGWAGDGHGKEPANRTAYFRFESPVDLGEKGKITIRLKHRSAHTRHNIGRFRLSLTDSESPSVQGGADLPSDVLAALKTAPAKRNDKQKQLLESTYRDQSTLLADARKHKADLKAQLDTAEKAVRTMLVSEPLPEPRMTRVLARGNWMDKDGEIVQPELPSFLPRDNDLPADRRANRLDLAHWIVGDSNPLTSRTMVNRIWKLFFGSGISADLEDLGGQGTPPNNPELLDWLAIEYRTNGWDTKALIREILLSDAYQRTSIPTADQLKLDPENLHYARQGRWRLEAEFIRDTALEVAGLLQREELGGQSVKPYQPAGYWQHLNFPKRKWEPGKGHDLYRRGIYTFWCRTFTHPAMVAFDAPSREECIAKRNSSNIPQQALVLLNDPVFVEAARAFGEKIATSDVENKLAYAWKLATGREIAAAEQAVLEELYQTQKARFTADTEAAKQLVSTGNTPAPEGDLVEVAALTQVARAIFNAYETTSRF